MVKLLIYGLLFFLFFILGCKSEKSSEDAFEEEISLTDQVSKAKQIIYGIPSPVETAMLLKRAGAKYSQEFLNPIENLGNYTSTLSMALNLGIYSADLSFSSLFEQSQASIKYLSACKKLADDLGILNAIDKTLITRMENNITNKDSVMEIISESFMNTNSFLKENDRGEIAAIILAGGWIEGLYLSTQIVKNTDYNQEIMERIADQRLSLYTLINMLSTYKNDMNVKKVIDMLQKIKSPFDKIQTKSSKIEVIEKNGKSYISSTSEIVFPKEVFDELEATVAQVRYEIIK